MNLIEVLVQMFGRDVAVIIMSFVWPPRRITEHDLSEKLVERIDELWDRSDIYYYIRNDGTFVLGCEYHWKKVCSFKYEGDLIEAKEYICSGIRNRELNI